MLYTYPSYNIYFINILLPSLKVFVSPLDIHSFNSKSMQYVVYLLKNHK